MLLVFDGVKMGAPDRLQASFLAGLRSSHRRIPLCRVAGANISLNGKFLGTANDQFLRFAFPVTPSHLPAPVSPTLSSDRERSFGSGRELSVGPQDGGAHELTVAFDTSIDCGGRWMACTGGWDWAPYSYTKQG